MIMPVEICLFKISSEQNSPVILLLQKFRKKKSEKTMEIWEIKYTNESTEIRD